MKKIATAFFMAWGMFFAVPCPYRKWDDALRGAMLLCFPLIGALIGGIWAAVSWLLMRAACPPLLTAVFLTAVPFLLTGFIHLDGFMDCCDAILSRRDLEERRKILKDSRTGSFAVICIVLLLLTEVSLFDAADLTGGRRLYLVLIPVVSRLCSAAAVFGLEPMWQGTINWKILLSYYAVGFPMDLVQAAATALFLWFLSQPMLEKLDRIKVKYGLVEPVCVLRSAPSGACVAAEGSSFPTEIF